MDKRSFRQRIEGEILILDGGYGTMLQPHLRPGSCIDLVNIEKPDLVSRMYSAYAESGADIVSTNTFGASRVKLQEYGLGDKVREINFQAAKSAKKVVGDHVWIAGCIGPTGKLIEPLGKLTFDETYETFREQATALAEGGVDLFLLETFSDLKEIKIAVLALKDTADLPIMASMTFDESFLSFTGTDPISAANVLVSLGVDALGVNCSTGPEPMLEVIGRYALVTDCPLFVEPNAGIPKLEKQKAAYQVTPTEMADFGEKFVQIGANIVGSCCGSTPEYTEELRKRLKGKKPLSRRVNPVLRLSSRVHTVEIGSSLPFCVIGERINPTNRKDLAAEIRGGKISYIQKEAQKQAVEGACVLDVNVGIPSINESGMMMKVVRGIENVVKIPLSIDSMNSQAVEAALRESSGKVLINSVNGDERSLKDMIPLAKRFGAGLLCLAVGKDGIPKTAEGRLAVLKEIIKTAEEAGIARQNLICDCLTLTVSAQQKRAEETLRAVRIVKEELGLPTVLGISNISYGLPERSLINSTFLSMAMAVGLDAAIMNPGDARMMETVRASSVLTVRDKDSREFIESYIKKKRVRKMEGERGRDDLAIERARARDQESTLDQERGQLPKEERERQGEDQLPTDERETRKQVRITIEEDKSRERNRSERESNRDEGSTLDQVRGQDRVRLGRLPKEEDWGIMQAFILGNRDEISLLVEKILASGKSAMEINKQMLIPAIQEIGRKYERKEIYLPQMIRAAETMQQAFQTLEPHFGSSETTAQGTVLICTVKGDVHDIGKNIVGLFLKNHGFHVIDLGKDVPAERIAEKAQETNADVVGLSALMTTTMQEMPNVIDTLQKVGSSAKVIVGGAVVTKNYAKDIGASGYAKNGISAVDLVKSLVVK